MNIVDKFKNLSRQKQIIFCAAVVLVIAVAVLSIILIRNQQLNKNMQILKTSGTVNIEDGRGGSKPVPGKIRFRSGEAINTGSDGLVTVGLDDTKTVILQNDSRAEFQKEGKRLELKLTKGAVSFSVPGQLKPDETFAIKTLTMTAGTGGASGMVYYKTNK